MYKMENDELLDRIDSAIYSIKEAMNELEGIEELNEDYIGLDCIRASLKERLEELEKELNEEEQENLAEMNREYMSSVL